jgi:hypothetical protein
METDMVRKTDNRETTEPFPEGDAKPKASKPEANADDPGLNSAVDAAEKGGSSPDLKAPDIQEKGNFPSAEDAYADMSQPAPAPPPERFSLDHSSSPPKAAFRVKEREGNGHFLWMFNMPFGTAGRGEAFTHSIAATLRGDLLKECPQLVPKRYEIRLTVEAGTDLRYGLLEVPADPAATAKGEDHRLAF